MSESMPDTHPQPEARAHVGTRTILLSALIGLAAGFLAGLLGIGGGVLKVPAFVFTLGMSQFLAAGTSAFTNITSAGAGALKFGSNDAINWTAAVTVFAGSAVGAWYGAKQLHRIPEYALAGVFSVVMLVSAVRMWF